MRRLKKYGYILINREYSIGVLLMEKFEEALRNIDIFCRILVKKIIENDDCSQNKAVEPLEHLIRRKYIIEENLESTPSTKYLIPIAEAEEPLIDVFEDENYVKIFVQCHCQGKDVKIHTDANNIGIHVDECRKLNLPVRRIDIENMVVRCNNNTILEVVIAKIDATAGYSK
jgi:hypothetical protein